MSQENNILSINTVKHSTDYNGNTSGYILNGSVSVPLDPANRHYAAIQEWVAEGNTIQEAEE